ncbi:L,D-transpeptidase [Streptomyces sp. NPDC029006]|uniref:L,D-transpeptidase n=1 Tax=Streptomyces sp. NPDC029006 TaxID=3155467 RepID=UPI0033F00687
MISGRLVYRGIAVLLAAGTAFPVAGSPGTAVAAVAAARAVPTPRSPDIPPEPPAPGPAPGSARATAPLSDLVPGVPPSPAQPGQTDTPDQALPPRVHAVAKVTCTRRTGPYQRQVERWLKLKVDGRQSASDCKTIRAFQIAYRIKPAGGFAGPVTWSTMMLISAGKNPNAAGKCPVRSYRVACVDLDRQLTWVQKGSRVVFGPVPMRSGGRGHVTRKGWHTVYWRHKNHVSTLYGQAMPYAQFFDGGQAFHAVHGSIHTTAGSMGCVNLRLADARTLWGVLKKGDRVFVWGRRAGT